MSDDKSILYKNSARENNNNNIKSKYIPQYQILGIEPSQYKSPVIPGIKLDKSRDNSLPLDNPRAKRRLINQPYAEVVVPNSVNNQIPNVGNNMEHTWASVDRENIDSDDSLIDENHPMIDNNDFVDLDGSLNLSVSSNKIDSEYASLYEEIVDSKIELDSSLLSDNEEEIKPQYNFSLLNDNEYVLLINNSFFSTGSLEEIQTETRDLVFGEHKTHKGSVSLDDIIILKRVKIKVGLFLE